LSYLCFWCLITEALYIFWVIIICLLNSWQKFSPILCYSFCRLLSLTCYRSLIWCNPSCQFLLLLPEQLKPYTESCYLFIDLQVTAFLFCSFKVWGLTLRCLIHFELIFVQGQYIESYWLLYADFASFYFAKSVYQI
jgi:hypothetical protein